MKKATKAWLQKHLDQPVVRGLKRKSPNVFCANESSISVQASETHWCTPKQNSGPYASVEIWPRGMESLDEHVGAWRTERDDPMGWVPLDTVVNLINANGGLK